MLNKIYIESTIQRISTKYGCLQINSQSNLQSFSENSNDLILNYPKDHYVDQEKPPCLTSKNKKCNEHYKWPQMSSVIISPNSQSSQKANKKSKK